MAYPSSCDSLLPVREFGYHGAHTNSQMIYKNIHNDKSTTYSSLNIKGIPAFDALNIIQNELKEDGLTNYDLGSYTTIQMLPEADLLIQHSIGKNLVNQNEYPKTTNIHNNLVKTLANLLHAPDADRAFGSSTIGSSEAIFLAILAAKWQWKNRNTGGNPNIVFCSNAHLSWHKFARYLDIETLEVELDTINAFPLDKVMKRIDQDTILVVSILGCTYMGTCDPAQKLNNSLEKLNRENNWDIGIHIDAAIGGFILPFFRKQQEIWDFKLPLVRSINLSGHKYGLVYPGLGWLLFRDKNYFKSELSMDSNYLNGHFDSYTVNFSRSSSLVIAQYFNFLHYGFEGYQEIVKKCTENANLLCISITDSGYFEVISDMRLPIVVFKFKENPQFNISDFTKLLRERKWMLPNYQLSGNLTDTVMRVVVRDDMSESTIKLLINDLIDCYVTLDNKL